MVLDQIAAPLCTLPSVPGLIGADNALSSTARQPGDIDGSALTTRPDPQSAPSPYPPPRTSGLTAPDRRVGGTLPADPSLPATPTPAHLLARLKRAPCGPPAGSRRPGCRSPPPCALPRRAVGPGKERYRSRPPDGGPGCRRRPARGRLRGRAHRRARGPLSGNSARGVLRHAAGKEGYGADRVAGPYVGKGCRSQIGALV